jgi:leucyl-tRNA synthetase
LLFMAPFESNTVWEEEGIAGAKHFLDRVWRFVSEIIDSECESGTDPGTLTGKLHRTVRQVTEDLEAFKFNTAIAALMEFLNAMSVCLHKTGTTRELKDVVRTYVLLMAPFVPHIAEELWARLGGAYSVHQQSWPEWDEAMAAEENIVLVVQVNGKVRARIEAPSDVDDKTAEEIALSDEKVLRQINGRKILKVFCVKGRLINLVTA